MSHLRLRVSVAGLVVLLVAAAVGNYIRPVPAATGVSSVSSPGSGGSLPSIPWPASGQSALAIKGTGATIATQGAHPLPIASVTKVMTALLTLEAKPLTPGQQGPAITLTDADVRDFQTAQASSQSFVQVQAGEQITEYQALQGLMLPSGNNLASTLARWAGGSEAAFVQQMNARAKSLGMQQTSFKDPSGFSDQNVSTPTDLTYLGQAAMANPALAEIVAQPQANLPVAGTVFNVNTLVGKDGIVGIKTGSLPPPAGSLLLFAANVAAPGGGTAMIIGAVQGLEQLDQVFDATHTLLAAVPAALYKAKIASRGQTVGHYQAPWGGTVPVVATEDVALVQWKGTPLKVNLALSDLEAPATSGKVVGKLQAVSGRGGYATPVVTDGGLQSPGPLWRIVRTPWGP
jgi:serine-type D-Ala-D-Ala carboxypeptidase (penicillin-binding protein 5/6)